MNPPQSAFFERASPWPSVRGVPSPSWCDCSQVPSRAGLQSLVRRCFKAADRPPRPSRPDEDMA